MGSAGAVPPSVETTFPSLWELNQLIRDKIRSFHQASMMLKNDGNDLVKCGDLLTDTDVLAA